MKVIREESGQALVLTAVLMVTLVGFLAFATDVGILFHQKRIAQAVADSAAMAAASDLKAGMPVSGLQAAVRSDITQNYDSSWASAVTISAPPVDGPHAGKSGYAEAVVAQPTPTLFMRTFAGLFGSGSGSRFNNATVVARAVGTNTIASTPCINIPNPSGTKPAVDMGGNSSVTGDNCGMVVNGDMTVSGSASIVAGYVDATGSITGSSKITGTVEQNAPPQSDPLASFSQPENEPQLNNTGGCTSPDGSTCFLNAKLSGTLNSGVYMFTQTPIFGSSADGSAGVMIYLGGSVGFSPGNMSLKLTPLASGLYSGIVIDAPLDVATDNSCASGNGKNNNTPGTLDINFGSSATTLSGKVYAPSAHLFMQDQGAGTTTVNADLIVGTLCDQSANIKVTGTSLGGSITQIGLVE